MREIIADIIPDLTHDEKIELVDALKAALAEEFVGPSEDPHFCPRCGKTRFVKKGRNRDKSQRWLCLECGRTFSHKTHGLLAYSKLKPDVWMTYAECMADALPLRTTAERCNVSLYTAWHMRMRVCEVMELRLEPMRKGTFHVDGTLVSENLSGNNGKSDYYSMPREAHRNGQDAKSEPNGIRATKVSILCGVNELGDCFCKVGKRSTETSWDVWNTLTKHIPEGSIVVTDGHGAYNSVPTYLAEHVVIKPHDPSTGNINMVNALHSRLHAFLKRMNGVSSRRLQKYLDWFCYREQFKRTDADRRQLLFEHEATGHYYFTRRQLHAWPRYDGWWWKQKMSTVV